MHLAEANSEESKYKAPDISKSGLSGKMRYKDIIIVVFLRQPKNITKVPEHITKAIIHLAWIRACANLLIKSSSFHCRTSLLISMVSLFVLIAYASGLLRGS